MISIYFFLSLCEFWSSNPIGMQMNRALHTKTILLLGSHFCQIFSTYFYVNNLRPPKNTPILRRHFSMTSWASFVVRSTELLKTWRLKIKLNKSLRKSKWKPFSIVVCSLQDCWRGCFGIKMATVWSCVWLNRVLLMSFARRHAWWTDCRTWMKLNVNIDCRCDFFWLFFLWNMSLFSA